MPNEHLDMDAIEARANAAPPDPWTVHYSHDRRTYEVWLDAMCIATGCTAPEAEFIASARTDVPALCARVRELETKVREYEDEDRTLAVRRNMAQEIDAAVDVLIEAGYGDSTEPLATDIRHLATRVHELEAKIEPIRQGLRLACASSCTCMTKTPDIVFHSAGCVYRRLVELERSL